MAPGQKADVEISIGIVMANVEKEITKLGAKLQNLKPGGVAANNAAESIVKLDSKLSNLNKQLAPKTTPFAGWAMSVMFFGMALQRIFDTVWKSGTKTFQDVMHSVEGTVTKFDILNGSVAYLQFNIGQALEPVVEWLIPIIDSISEWISNNQELFAGLVVIAGILGTLAFAGGSLMLAYNGFKDLFVLVSSLVSMDISSGIFGLTASAPFIVALSLAAIAAAAFFAAFKESPVFKETFISGVLEPFKVAWNNIKDTFSALLTEGGLLYSDLDLLGGIILILSRIFIDTFVVALMLVIDSIIILINVANAAWLAMSGDSEGANAALNRVRNGYAATIAAYKAGSKDMKDMLASIGEGGVTLTGQMEYYNKSPKMNTMADAPTAEQWASIQPRTYNYYISGYDLQTSLDIVKRES